MNRKQLRILIEKEIKEAINREEYPPMSFVDAMDKIAEIANTAPLNKSRNMPGHMSDLDYYQKILSILRQTQYNPQLLPGEEYDPEKHGIGE